MVVLKLYKFLRSVRQLCFIVLYIPILQSTLFRRNVSLTFIYLVATYFKTLKTAAHSVSDTANQRNLPLITTSTASAEPHLQVPCLPHILPQDVVFQAVKCALSYWCLWGSHTGFPKVAHQPIRIFAVKLTELCWPTVGLPSHDAVGPIKLLLYGVMMKLQVPHNGQNVATKAADALSQQEEPVSHPSQLQVLLGFWATDAAIIKWQISRWIAGHGKICERGAEIRVLDEKELRRQENTNI